MKTFLSHTRIVLTSLAVLTSNQIACASRLPDIVRETMKAYFEPEVKSDARTTAIASTDKNDKLLSARAGVFVTLSKNGKTRACWGSVNPEAPSLSAATANATIGALTKDYRYKPIKASEWAHLKPQVTVIKSVDPISNIRQFNPLQDGLMIRSGGKSGVLLPREAIDATYALVQCKLKAGIKAGEPFQMYKLKAQIYE